jgi:hypothetical protein
VPFPISLSGEAAVRDVTVDQAIGRLERALANADARALRREGSALQFQGGIFRLVSSWNVLGPISDGVLQFSPSADGVKVSYRVMFGQMLVVVTLMATFVGAFMATAPYATVGSGLGVPALMWAWLFGGNFALARWRWPAFLARSLSQPAR